MYRVAKITIERHNTSEALNLGKSYMRRDSSCFSQADELAEVYNMLDSIRSKSIQHEANKDALKHVLNELERIIDADVETITAKFNKERGAA
jgi:hypothetical protein